MDDLLFLYCWSSSIFQTSDKNEIDNAISIFFFPLSNRLTEVKCHYCGKSAENGIIACDIAKNTGPIDVFEDGIFKILSNNQFDLNFIDNLGNDFYLLNSGKNILFVMQV